ncbi:hypothetical protein BCR42DRAFT_419478 [Absidia repens]|uniref:Uncharacterized protein n=1 Tax=Absidia repens TaxID=90262 RepID=A0A1X2IBC1_9FUNG|nr:hypothetical protein BCR42DRAFT_419478 [Absidia repens]
MSSVQAVIAALNQQNNQNDPRQPSNRQSKSNHDVASIRDRFGASPNATTEFKIHRSSHMEKRGTTTATVNRPASSLVPLRHDSLMDSTTRTKINHQQATKQQLVERLERMNMEINQLKQQLYDNAIDTPNTRTCELPETEMPTLPPACFIWFDVDDDSMDNNSNIEGDNLSSSEIDYDDVIADYNRHIFTQGQQQQNINTLQRQLAACEIGTQWMMNKYLGELELERLHTRSLDTIVQNQEDLINIMESKPIEPVDTAHQEQQTFLLHSQLELQRMELDDKQEMINLMADERDILVNKIKRLSQQLHQQQYYINQTPQHCAVESMEKRSKNHPRSPSSSSTCSTSSYNTTVSSTSTSCLDWVNINGIQQHNQSTYLLSSFSKHPTAAGNLYSPPQTPPPREKLPPLPTSSSSSSVTTTPNLSPRSTLVSATPSLSSSLATLESSSSLSSSTTSDYQGSLSHQSSMPDIRSYHDQQYHRRTTYHHRRDSGDPALGSPVGRHEKGAIRQKSFWKGWRQRLSS